MKNFLELEYASGRKVQGKYLSCQKELRLYYAYIVRKGSGQTGKEQSREEWEKEGKSRRKRRKIEHFGGKGCRGAGRKRLRHYQWKRVE